MSFDGSLAVWLREQSGLLPLSKVIVLVRKAADTLQVLHNQHIVHQDVNAASFLVRADNNNADQLELRLADTGASVRAFSLFGRSFPANSQPLYMAPEQWSGQAVPATDQYALAVMTYELLTGLAPFQGPPAQLMDSHLNVQPTAPSTFNQRVSTAIDAVMMNALAKRPEDRFPSIFAFARALEEALYHPEALIVSVPRATSDGNLRATLHVSRSEAIAGTLRTITLPQGRKITVAVPAGAYDGQIIRLENLGDTGANGTTGSVLLSIAVSTTETHPLPVIVAAEKNTVLPKSVPVTPVIITDAAPVQARKEEERAATKVPTFIERSRTLTNQAYTSLATLSLNRKLILFTSVALIVILLGISIFSFTQANAKTPIAYAPNNGLLALSDSLHDNSGSSNWPENVGADGSFCHFTQGGYHVSTVQVGSLHYCAAGVSNFNDFAYEARMTLLKGDQGGLIFRADGSNSKLYYFTIGRDGSYGLYLFVDGVGSHAKTLASGLTPSVHTGLNISNLLAVVARGSTIDIYVNNQHVTSINNTTYSSGQIGVASSSLTDATEAVFTNVKVWTL